MPPRKPLRAVKPGETAPEPKPARAKSVTQAAAGGTQLELLVALRKRLAATVQDPNCPPRDLAALSRRLLEIAREIEAIESETKEDEMTTAAGTPDEPWDSEAI